MTETYRLTELARANEQAAEYRKQYEAAERGTQERIDAGEWLEFWQKKATFLWAMRLHTDKE